MSLVYGDSTHDINWLSSHQWRNRTMPSVGTSSGEMMYRPRTRATYFNYSPVHNSYQQAGGITSTTSTVMIASYESTDITRLAPQYTNKPFVSDLRTSNAEKKHAQA